MADIQTEKSLHRQLLEMGFNNVLFAPRNYNYREIVHNRNEKTLYFTGMKKSLNDVLEFCILPSELVPETLVKLPPKKRELEYQVIYYKKID